MKPILSIIIPTFNTAKMTSECILSILEDKGLDFGNNSDSQSTPAEIIIIDNNSTDNSIDLFTQIYKKNGVSNYQFIKNDHNTGFGVANNQGLKISQGNYILFLNSDTIILHSAISQSLNWLSSHPEANICTAQLLNTDKTIQASGGFFPNLLNVFTWCFSLDDLPFVNKFIPPIHPHTPNFYTHDSYYLYDHAQDWVTGAYMMVRKSILDKAGYFDESYFLYGEELELTYRIKKSDPHGQAWYLVGPQIIHLGGASSATRSAPLFKEYEGMIAFFAKHKPAWQLSLVKLFIKINRIARIIIFTLVGKPQIANLYRHESI